MIAPGRSGSRTDEAPPRDRGPAAPSKRVPHLRVYVVVVVALVGGFVARSFVSGEAADNPLLNWLPWLNRTSITLYFADGSGDHLVPVSRTVSHSAEPSALVDGLLAGPEPGTGLTQLIPANTALSSVALADGLLTVDLSGDGEAFASPLVRNALFLSLGSWPGVDDVRVSVSGRALDDPEGHYLYFYDEPLDMLVAEATEAASPRDVVAAYLAGPVSSRFIGLPDDVRLLSLDLSRANGLLSLNFTYTPSVREFALDHPVAMRRVLEGMLAGLTAGFPGVDAVWLDFEGHEALGLGQCADLLRTAQTRPEVLNDERLLERHAGV